ncbi:MAG: AAA family ATPase [Chloroflexota bacterium]
MLTRLSFKNWRSLRDVTIDNLTPITVFVGANSSGKTNIIDGLDFLRFAFDEGLLPAVGKWGGQHEIRYRRAQQTEPIEIETKFKEIDGLQGPITETISLAFPVNNPNILLKFRRTLLEDGSSLIYNELYTLPFVQDSGRRVTEPDLNSLERADAISGVLNTLLKKRIQLISEDFITPIRGEYFDDPYVINKQGSNVPSMLYYMQQFAPDVFNHFQEDVSQLLSHVSSVTLLQNGQEVELEVAEPALGGKSAPTISAGTRRLISVLAAYYALDLPSPTMPQPRKPEVPDMRSPNAPGLVIVEDADIALHPLLLGNFVDLLRSYTDRKEPRQFILTTHNPQLLNYFQPEEIRVVERDPETGETSVDNVPEYLKETWLPNHRLGEAWTSRLIGGIPEV